MSLSGGRLGFLALATRLEVRVLDEAPRRRMGQLVLARRVSARRLVAAIALPAAATTLVAEHGTDERLHHVLHAERRRGGRGI